MSTIRTNNIYVSSQTWRWLKWMSEVDGIVEGKASTPDSIAENILRAHLLESQPELEKLEAEYWSARKKLDEETVGKLKQQTKSNEKREVPESEL